MLRKAHALNPHPATQVPSGELSCCESAMAEPELSGRNPIITTCPCSPPTRPTWHRARGQEVERRHTSAERDVLGQVDGGGGQEAEDGGSANASV